MNRIKSWVCLLLVVVLMAACVPAFATAADGQLRVVCMAPSMVEAVYALGCEDMIVGWSAYADYPVAVTETKGYQPYQDYYDVAIEDFDVAHELEKDVATVSKYGEYSKAVLDALDADVILCEGSEQANWQEELTAQGYQVYWYSATCIDDVFNMMLEVGKLLQVNDRAEELVAGYRARIDEIRAVTSKLTPIRTYFEIAHQMDYGNDMIYGPYTEGSGAPLQEMIEIAGGVNIFSDLAGYVNLLDVYGKDSFAEIAKRDPQVILSPYWPGAFDYEVTTIYEIMTRPDFNTTQAVLDGRVYYYDSSLMKRYGPRTVTAIEKLAYLLHPYYFSNPENSVSQWELGKIDRAEPMPAPLN